MSGCYGKAVISTTPPPAGQTVLARDTYRIIGGATNLEPGRPQSLGRVLFDVASGATLGSVVPVVLNTGMTGLFDGSGNSVPITRFTNGSITVAPAVVPEPSTFALGSLGGMLALGYGWRRRQAAA